ncbi:MAG TPA: hypothetical protein VNW97_00370 [Candidatus Saccharimonadales bacterium]|jgi:hypothetical protein|nr:hypothetical protein [Candidatus Saccharimonadales bacterium]
MSNQMMQSAPAAPNAFQAWMGQWRLATLDVDGCLYVLRYVLNAFRSRKPEDGFWRMLEEFLCSEESGLDPIERPRTAKEMLAQAGSLNPEQAGALLSFLCQYYFATEDRLFWGTVSDAIQLYTVAPSPSIRYRRSA